MKSLNIIRIPLLIVGLFISYELASKEAAIYLNEKYNTVTISQLNQTDDVVKIAVTNELGKDPGFDGLKVLLSKLKVKVEKKLRGNIPYRIKSTIKDGTIIPIRIGNELRLEVTLFKCEESSRHWFFEAAAGIYSYNNNPSMGPITSAVKLKVMEKARSSSLPSQQILGLFPSHISLVGFSNLNSGDPNKEYKAVFEFLTAQRPADYVEVVHNDVIDPDYDELSENTNQELVYLPNNQDLELSEKSNSVEKQNIINSTNNISSSTLNKQMSYNTKSSVSMKEVLMYEAAIKKSKASPEKKKELLITIKKLKALLNEQNAIEKQGAGVMEYVDGLISGKEYQSPKNCIKCNGTGVMKTCMRCLGDGIIHCQTCKGYKKTADGRVCLNCSGQGIKRCYICNGRKFNIKCNHKIFL